MITGILFDADRQDGGSYQMSINNLLIFINNFKKQNIKYIILTHKKNFHLDQLKIKYEIIKISITDFFFLIFRNIKIFKFLFTKFNYQSSFEKKLIKKNISMFVFFFTSWKSFLLNKIKFTATVMDVCHYDFYKKKNFKEISSLVFIYRQYLYKNILPLAYRIITESNDLKKRIIRLYKLKSNSIISIPNLPSMLLNNKKNINTIKIVKNKYNIFNKFYLYPAQFWEHKNHIIILEAIKKLKFKKNNITFIFCGRDKGNLEYINKKIAEYEIQKNVKIIGYVSDHELLVLYKLCKALVMPSFFGPTNIPPVEAWSLDVPVLYSSLNRNHGKNAAIYFNPNSSNQLAKAILKADLRNSREELIRKGRLRLKDIKKENLLGHGSFSLDIKKFLSINLKPR
jgi:glycosyltransferase involved in cell wall biosynthesis